MDKELSRRRLLRRLGLTGLAGAAAVAGRHSLAWGQFYRPPPRFSREDMVHLFEGPWRGLRAVIEKKVTDIHCHLSRVKTAEGLVASAEELITSMDTHGIRKACVGISDLTKVGVSDPFRARPDKIVPGWGDEQIRAMEKYPGRFVILFNPDFHHPGQAAEELRKRLRNNGVKGIGESDAAETTVEEACLVMEIAEEFNLPVLWGVRAGARAEGDPKAVAKFASAFPRVNHIIGDGGGEGFAFGGGWQAIAVAASYPNVYLEIGGAPVQIIDAAVKNLGAERVLFGSDFSGFDSLYRPGVVFQQRDGKMHWRNLNAVALSNTSPAQRELILHKNTDRLFKME